MINKLQFENSNRYFIDFGAILYIFAWFYVFDQIFYLFEANIYSFNSILYLTLYFSFLIIFSILLYLLMRNTKNIEKNLPNNKNIKIFSIGLEIWFGIFVISTIIAIIQLSQTSLQSYLVWKIFGDVMLIFSAIFEFITWIFLNSFIVNSRDYFPSDIKKNGHIATKILMISAVLEIFYLGINMFATYGAQSLESSGLYNAIVWILLIINYSTILLFLIGYFVLSVSLKRIKQIGFKINDMMRQQIEIPTGRDTSIIENMTVDKPNIKDPAVDGSNIKDLSINEPDFKDLSINKPNIKDPAVDESNINDSTVNYPSVENLIKDYTKIENSSIENIAANARETQNQGVKAPIKSFCPYCGNHITPKMKFCRFCGNPIEK